MSQVSTIKRERVHIVALNLDGNKLSTLHGIKQFPSLIQVSLVCNMYNNLVYHYAVGIDTPPVDHSISAKVGVGL